MLLDRVWPAPKGGRPVTLALPELRTPADVTAALAAIVQAVAAGEINPDEGQAVAGVVELHRRAVETEDLAARIAALEARTSR